MNRQEIINKLESIRYPYIDVPGHRSRLKAALISSGLIGRRTSVNFFRLNHRGLEMSLSRGVMIPAGVLLLVIIAIVGRLGWSTYHSAQMAGAAPVNVSGMLLSVMNPSDNATINSGMVSVKGRTLPGAVVSINDQITTADERGDFSYNLDLDTGINVISITVSNDAGQQASTTIVVNSGGDA